VKPYCNVLPFSYKQTLLYFISFLTAINLRSYQLDGVRWLSQCMEIQEGCILGDEMGLGKTCQVSNVMGLSCLRSIKDLFQDIRYQISEMSSSAVDHLFAGICSWMS